MASRTSHPPKRARRLLAGLLRFLTFGVLQRIYAAAMIVAIVWVSWAAVRYLIVSLISPIQTPAQISGVPLRMDDALLHGARTDWLGLSAVDNPRSPPSHFHRFETWIQADPYNDCTRSGCHGPLPHSKSKEVRAFANMHATSMHCGVCHFKSDSTPLNVVWYDLRNGNVRERPTLLEAYDWLEQRARNTAADFDRGPQREIARLLRTAAEEGGGVPVLNRLADDIAAVRPASEPLMQLLEQARDAVRTSLRGSYGAKLALRDANGRPMLSHPGAEGAVAEWLARGAQTSGAEREQLLGAVHPLRRSTPLDCGACHHADNAMLQYAAAGYPAARLRALTQSMIFDMIQHIREGRPFHIPMVGAPLPPPASQPATNP